MKISAFLRPSDKALKVKRRILAGYGIVTENGYFTDFELSFERKNNPTFLTIPYANYGRNMKKFDFSSCATSRSVLVDILS